MVGTPRVGIVTDSTADIPRELAAELGITVVPLSVTLEGTTYLDGEMPLGEFLARMAAAKQLPTTSQPPVGAFAEAFREKLKTCADVICVTVSGKLSGTFESAAEAAREVGSRVHVLDSLNLSWGEGYRVMAATRAAARHATVDEIVRTFEQVRSKINIVVGLDSLDNLAKGGRIGKVSALVGGILNVRVLLTIVDDGTFERVYRGSGAKAALQTTVDWMAGRVDATKEAAFAVLHSGSPEKAEWLEWAVRERFTVAELRTIETGQVIGTHTGTGWGLTGVELG